MACTRNLSRGTSTTETKRAAEIQAEMDATGDESYQARNIAARTTRDPKRHTPVELLMRRGGPGQGDRAYRSGC
jgi:hypothetical protein